MFLPCVVYNVFVGWTGRRDTLPRQPETKSPQAAHYQSGRARHVCLCLFVCTYLQDNLNEFFDLGF